MSEMIERLAAEFMRKSLEGCEVEFIKACDPKFCRCRFFAAVAIESMREPTEEMCETAAEVHNVWGFGAADARTAYRTMINAALATPSKAGG